MKDCKDKNTFSQVSRIKTLCKEKNVTMVDIAHKLGITPVSLSQSLAGNPTYSRLKDIADVLKVDITELFETKHSQQPSIDGFVEINGWTYRIHSIIDLEKALDQAKNLAKTNDDNSDSNYDSDNPIMG